MQAVERGGVSVCHPSHQTAVSEGLSWELQGVPADLWSDTQHGCLNRGELCASLTPLGDLLPFPSITHSFSHTRTRADAHPPTPTQTLFLSLASSFCFTHTHMDTCHSHYAQAHPTSSESGENKRQRASKRGE